MKIDTITEKSERQLLFNIILEKYKNINTTLETELNGMRLTKGISEDLFKIHKSKFDKATDSANILRPFIETFDQNQKKLIQLKS